MQREELGASRASGLLHWWMCGTGGCNRRSYGQVRLIRRGCTGGSSVLVFSAPPRSAGPRPRCGHHPPPPKFVYVSAHRTKLEGVAPPVAPLSKRTGAKSVLVP